MKRFQSPISVCDSHVLLKEMFNRTPAHKLSGHFIYNLVFTKPVLMIPTETALGLMDSRQPSAL